MKKYYTHTVIFLALYFVLRYYCYWFVLWNRISQTLKVNSLKPEEKHAHINTCAWPTGCVNWHASIMSNLRISLCQIGLKSLWSNPAFYLRPSQTFIFWGSGMFTYKMIYFILLFCVFLIASRNSVHPINPSNFLTSSWSCFYFLLNWKLHLNQFTAYNMQSNSLQANQETTKQVLRCLSFPSCEIPLWLCSWYVLKKKKMCN